jgi:hypothetical protein
MIAYKRQTFEEIGHRLQTLDAQGSHSLHGESEIFFRRTQALQEEMRSHLESTRNILAAAKEVILFFHD